MDLIDRYLVAVRRHLPRDIQDDIVRELADSLRSEAEERERELGRTLTGEELAGLLQQRGHPWLMASRYLPQQHLIGPALFPYYRRALTVLIFWVVLPLTLVGGAIAAIYAGHGTFNPFFSGDAWRVWGRTLNAAWNGAIYTVGITTIVFAILEREQVRITALDRWDPASLPEPGHGRAVPRSESVFDLIVSLTILVWAVDLVRMPSLIHYDSKPVQFVVGPIWGQVFYPFLAAVTGGVALALIDLIRPWRTTLVTSFALVVNAAQIAIVLVLLRAGHWVTMAAGPDVAEQASTAELWANRSIHVALLVAAVILIADTLYEIWRMARSRRDDVVWAK